MTIRHSTFMRQARHLPVITAVSAAVVLGAGCSTSPTAEQTSSTESPTAAAPLTSAPPPAIADRLSGMVDSVTGSTVAVTTKDGPATVDITPETRIMQVDPAQLSDVTPGICVDVRQLAGEPGSAPAPARSVTVSTPSKSGCPRSNVDNRLRGTAISVSGPTLGVADSSAVVATVQVDPKTRYLKRAKVTADAITPGVCLTASGSPEGTVLQASGATVKPAADGKCP